MDFFQSIFKVLSGNIVLMVVVILITALALFSLFYVIVDKIRNRNRSEAHPGSDLWNRNFETEYAAEKRGNHQNDLVPAVSSPESKENKKPAITVILPRDHKKEEKIEEPVLTSVPAAIVETRKTALLKKEEPTIVVKEFVLGDNLHDFVNMQGNGHAAPPVTDNRILKRAMLNRQFVSFVYDDTPVLMQPETITDTTITGYCYVRNEERECELSGVSEPALRISPFQVQASGPAVGIGRIREIINTAMHQNKHVRLKYANDDDTELIVLPSRRIAFNMKDEYITATLDNPLDERTFYFDRINEIAILNL